MREAGGGRNTLASYSECHSSWQPLATGPRPLPTISGIYDWLWWCSDPRALCQFTSPGFCAGRTGMLSETGKKGKEETTGKRTLIILTSGFSLNVHILFMVALAVQNHRNSVFLCLTQARCFPPNTDTLSLKKSRRQPGQRDRSRPDPKYNFFFKLLVPYLARPRSGSSRSWHQVADSTDSR